MVNTEEFVGRLEQIIQYHGLSASAFADKIRVQRSSISHVLTGRNKPSLEFVMKVVQAFPEVNLYWLLNGKGVFPSESTKPSSPSAQRATKNISKKIVATSAAPTAKEEKTIEKIIIFYDDGSFEPYVPRR
ncbi:helix-turn-helix domain-containing protein [Spongiimicrobium sp. 3-5]|uniref:helix-turn-helix domain-containing protein n=1 Tax=Spongiimicrobium sp. 3-5 TaxID=3332596 RepID=UPI0039803117